MPRPPLDGRPARRPRRRRLTDRFVRTVRPEPARALYWDEAQEGLVLVVHPTGRKVWRLYYRHGGRPRWYTIASASRLGLAAARAEARRLSAGMVTDPTLDVQAEKAAARRVGTFEELARRYLEEYAKRQLKSWDQSERDIERWLLPRWGHLQASTIRRADVRALHADLTSRDSPVSANKAVVRASAVFDWAIKNEVIDLPANPAHGVESNKAKPRERHLSDAEIPAFWTGIEEAGPVRAAALRMLLLTGQRPVEVGHMRRADVEIGEHRLTDQNGREYAAYGGWWHLPGEPQEGWPGTKNEQSHRVWLPAPAVALIEELDEGFYVFPGARGRPVSRLDQTMRALRVEPPVRPHDLRRTHGTLVTSLGFTRDQMNRLHNHKDGGIASVYDRHGYAHETRTIQEAVADLVMRRVGAAAAANVVRFDRS